MDYKPTLKTYEIPLTRKELAAMFRVTERTIDRHIQKGTLQCTILGNKTVRFYEYQIEAFLNKINANVPNEEKTQMAANL
jgi:excisionase family DNA binding protein